MRRAEGDIIEGWPLPSRSLPLPAATATLLGSVALHAMLLSWVAWSGADGLARPTPSAPAEFSLVTSGDLFEAQRPSREQAETQTALESPTIAPNSASSIDPPAADEAVASEPGTAPRVDRRPARTPETTAILRGSATELARLSERNAAASDALQALPADSPWTGGVVAARPPSPSPLTTAAAEAERRPSRDAAADIVHPAPVTGGARPTSPEPAPLLDRIVEEPVRQVAMAESAAPSLVRPSGTPTNDMNASPAPETVQGTSAARQAAQPAADSLRSTPLPEPAAASPEAQVLAARSVEARVVPAGSRTGAEIVAATVPATEVSSQWIAAVPAEDAAPAGPIGKGVISPPAPATQAVDPAPADTGQPAHVLPSTQAPEPAAPRELAAAIPAEPPARAPVAAATAIQIPASTARVPGPASADIEDSAPILQPSQASQEVAPRMLATAASVEPSRSPPVAANTASIALARPAADSPLPVVATPVSAAPSTPTASNETQPVIAPRGEARVADAPVSQEVAAVAPQAPTPTTFGARPTARQRIASETVGAARPDAASPAVAARDVVPVKGATSLRPREALPGSAASTPPNLAARAETGAASRTMPPAIAGTARAGEPIRSARATPVRPVTDHATAVRSFVSTYNGGDCFLLATNDVSDDSAAITGFGASTDPFVTFNDTFTTMQGFEADLGVRQVSQAHCPLISLLKSRGRPLPETLIDLTSSSIVSGGLVAGKIVPESGDVDPSAPPLLFLIDDAGQVHDARRFLQAGPEGWLFSFPLTLTGESSEAPVLLLAVFGVEPEERPEPFTSLPIEDFADQLDDLLETFSLAYLTVRE